VSSRRFTRPSIQPKQSIDSTICCWVTDGSPEAFFAIFT
jgi:hypothetical protein